MPQLDPSSFGSQLFWLAICFVTLYAVMAVVVLPRITKTLAARADQMEGDLAQAEALRDKAEAALAAYEEALAQARTRALGLAQDMRADVQAETDRQKGELDASLAEAAKAADIRLEDARTKAMEGLQTAAQNIVADVMAAVGVEKADEKAVAKAVTQAFASTSDTVKAG
ncbi:MAG: F0F1 ATP synthase subunit B' [Rhodobiaceae bacterium]|jgi:F-type H+-transporting ATPase subunit b|nr:F0F1 ATP synthase subunit B' [Rhodobiaceae bacterium]MBT5518503.1 F0F1 ATP synthase subunit B' [Rhodobiaceae bacterium]MBT7642656.1 F0F1 ATP synthase subunit B' [Rhodobiaceae bacterium]